MGGAASVKLKEIDLSTRVATFEGVYGAIVVPAKKGQLDKPSLVTSDTQFLNRYTPDGSVKVGYDLSYFSALAYLERSNKLWVQRVANAAHFAGAKIKASTSSGVSASFGASEDMVDPSAFVFDSQADTPAVAEVTEVLFSQLGSFYDVAGAAKAVQFVGHYFYITVSDGVDVQTDPALLGVGHAVVVLSADTAVQVAAKFKAVVDAVSGVFTSTITSAKVTVSYVAAGPQTDASVTGSFAAITVTIQGASAIDLDDEVLMIYSANEGAWGNSILVKIDNVTNNPDLIEPNSFQIQVFKAGNTVTPLETFLVSRVMGQKDGRGRNMFVEDVLQASSYIRAISNAVIADTVLPKVISTALALGDGDDGQAVTSSNMIAAANKFANKSQTSVTILMDGGYAVPAYQLALDTIAQQRQDCVAILTTPYSAEVDSDYLNEIVDYRKTQLNLNSSYSALYTPHLKIQDRFNDRELWVAPDGHVAGSISFSANNFEIWYPAAGFKRGVLNVLDAAKRFDDGELDALYTAGINPIKFFPGKGIVVWGQKTLQARASALDRLNVRLLLVVIEPAIKDLLENFLFELNDTATRSIIATKLESYLEGIRARKGVTDYAVVCDETNNEASDVDANRLNVDVYIKPSISIEEIPVRVVITPNNISFADAAGAV